MADKKISALTAATTPLAGTEVLPIVQGASTVKVSAANITAGRDVSAKTLTGESNGVGGPTEIFARNTAGGERIQLISRNSAGVSYVQTQNSQMLIGSFDNFAVQFMVNNASKLVLDTTSDVKVSTGNLVMSTAAKGIDFSANTGTAGMTSELLNWYEEGTFTPVWNGGSITVGLSKYTRIGRNVVWIFDITFGASVVVATSTLTLPFPCVDDWGVGSINYTDVGATLFVNLEGVSDTLQFRLTANAASTSVANLATKRVVGMAVYNA